METTEAKEWFEEEEQAEQRIQSLFTRTNFEAGGELKPDGFDELFRLMKRFSRNRALSNLIYNQIGVKEFNDLLRNLYYGKEPLPRRVDEMFKQRGIGIQTLSQFLMALDSSKYPLVTSQTKEMLELDAGQEEEARRDALSKYGIANPDEFLERTIDLLTDSVVFEKAKFELGLEKFSQVNNLIWFGRVQTQEGEEDNELPYTSLSVEDDLRDYLAAHPSLLEQGLSVIKKEFVAQGAGEIDILCKDKTGSHVVVELKKGRKSDVVMGQTLRYIGWVMKNMKTKTRGIVVVNEPDEKLDFAILPVANLIQVKYYRMKFELSEDFQGTK